MVWKYDTCSSRRSFSTHYHGLQDCTGSQSWMPMLVSFFRTTSRVSVLPASKLLALARLQMIVLKRDRKVGNIVYRKDEAKLHQTELEKNNINLFIINLTVFIILLYLLIIVPRKLPGEFHKHFFKRVWTYQGYRDSECYEMRKSCKERIFLRFNLFYLTLALESTVTPWVLVRLTLVLFWLVVFVSVHFQDWVDEKRHRPHLSLLAMLGRVVTATDFLSEP